MEYQYLYKLHTKRNRHQSSSESETSDVSNFSYINANEPPLYSFEELKQNLVVYDEKSIRNFDSDLSSQLSDNEEKSVPENIKELSQLIADVYCRNLKENKNFEDIKQNLDAELSKLQDVTTVEQIQKNLLKLTPWDVCKICNKNNIKNLHYKSANHIKKVRNWLTNQISKLQKPVEMKYLFCEICKLALPGNEIAKEHYNTTTHLEKSKTFCNVCLMSKADISNHVKSKTHINRLKQIKDCLMPISSNCDPKSKELVTGGISTTDEDDINKLHKLNKQPNIEVGQCERKPLKETLNKQTVIPQNTATSIAKFLEVISKNNLSKNIEETHLHNQMDREVKKLLELLYCSGKIPLEKAVSYLKLINEELSEEMKGK